MCQVWDVAKNCLGKARHFHKTQSIRSTGECYSFSTKINLQFHPLCLLIYKMQLSRKVGFTLLYCPFYSKWDHHVQNEHHAVLKKTSN